MHHKIHPDFPPFERLFFCSDLHLGQIKAAWYRGWHDGQPKFGMPKPQQKVELSKIPAEQLAQWSRLHDMTILSSIARLNLTPNDCVICLGDVAFTQEALDDYCQVTSPAVRFLIRGNNDLLSPLKYKEAFDEILGYWELVLQMPGLYPNPSTTLSLSHCPIHPNELRGRMNVHGHVHGDSILPLRNPGYLNLTWEGLQMYHNISLLPWPRILPPTKYSMSPVSPILTETQLQWMYMQFTKTSANQEPREFPA
jgi:calcineurin-like phosphoesterase family protein